MKRSTVATAGLFLAWLGHDVEEFITMPETSRRIMAKLPETLPVPAEWRASGIPRRHLAVGMSTMGLFMAAASADGYRTGGESAFYQNVLLGFGLHGIGHVGMAVALRGYASGVATSPTLVIPFWLAATRYLEASGVPARRSVRAAALSIPVSIWAAHGIAYALSRRRAAVASPDEAPSWSQAQFRRER